MPDPKPTEAPSLRAHRRQLIWQIVVPVVVMAAVIAAAGALVIAGEASRNRSLADVSTIWLIAPLLVLGLLLFTLLGTIIWGFHHLLHITPRYTGMAREVTARVAEGARKIADGAAQPLLWVNQAAAVLEALFKKLWS